MKKKFVEKRNRGTWKGFIMDMHSNEAGVSWMRWIGTLIISNIMGVWTLSCVFGPKWEIKFTLEEMPLNLAGIIGLVILGKVGQAAVDKKEEAK